MYFTTTSFVHPLDCDRKEEEEERGRLKIKREWLLKEINEMLVRALAIFLSHLYLMQIVFFFFCKLIPCAFVENKDENAYVWDSVLLFFIWLFLHDCVSHQSQ